MPTRCLRPSTTVVVVFWTSIGRVGPVGDGGGTTGTEAVGIGEAAVPGEAAVAWVAGTGAVLPGGVATAALARVSIRPDAVIEPVFARVKSPGMLMPSGVGDAMVGISPSVCGCTEDSSAPRNSSAVWKRSAGAFASARSRTRVHHGGRPGWNCEMGVGESFTCFWTIAMAVSALKGSWPDSSR